MLTHAEVWAAVDALAARHGLTASALARKAGLDATSFNRSKRVTGEGRQRWPSTESIAKILEATGSGMADFLGLAGAARPAAPARPRPLPLLGFARAGDGGFFGDGGFPAGVGWDEVDFPNPLDDHAYALEIEGDSMAPVYRDGDRIIVSPGVPIRRGDRVVVKTREGEVLAKELKRQTARTVELKSLNPDHPDRTFALPEIDWMARIVWSSQ